MGTRGRLSRSADFLDPTGESRHFATRRETSAQVGRPDIYPVQDRLEQPARPQANTTCSSPRAIGPSVRRRPQGCSATLLPTWIGRHPATYRPQPARPLPRRGLFHVRSPMIIFDITHVEAIAYLHAATKFIRATTDLLKLLREGRKAALPPKRREPDRRGRASQGQTGCPLSVRRVAPRLGSPRRPSSGRRKR